MERTPPRPRIARLLSFACWSAAALATLTIPVRLAAGLDWRLDLVATFASFIAIALAGAALLTFALRRWPPALILLALALIHTLWLATGRAPRADGAGAPTLSVMAFNVRATNPRHDDCIALLQRAPADVIVLIECSHRLAARIDESNPLRTLYPHRILPTESHEWNAAILSRHPLDPIPLRDELRAAGRRDELRRYRFQFLFQRACIIDAPAGRAIISGLWLTSPRTAERWQDGNRELRIAGEILTRYLQPLDLPIILACDLNATPSGWRSRELATRYHLRRAKPLAAPGSWPADRHPRLRIAIDDIIVSPGIHVTDWRLLDDSAGSDHLPVVATLRLPQP